MRKYFLEQILQKERYLPGVREFEKWFTTGDSASALGKTRQGIKWLLENRRLRGARTRLGWLVDPKDVERYAREHGIERKGENDG